MSTASICSLSDHPSTHLAPKSEPNTARRIKYVLVDGRDANKSQRIEATLRMAEASAVKRYLSQSLDERNRRDSFDSALLFANKIRDEGAQWEGGWVPTAKAKGLLQGKANRRKPPCKQTYYNAIKDLYAAGLLDVKRGFVRWLGAAHNRRKVRFYPQGPKFWTNSEGYNPSPEQSEAVCPRIAKVDALMRDAGGELPKRARNAQGRFTRSEPKANQTMQAGGLPGWRPKGRNIPPPPCPATPEELDEIDAELARLTDCLKKKKPQDTQPVSDASSALPPTPVELLTGGEAVTPAHSVEVQAEVPDPPLTASDAGVISVPVGSLNGAFSESSPDLDALNAGDADAMGSVAGAAGAEFTAMFAAFKARGAVLETPPQRIPKPSPKPLAPIVKRDVKRLTTGSSTARWERIERGGPVTRGWLADVFGSSELYRDLQFGSVRALNLDINSMLAARALVDGRKGIAKNHSAMLVAAAKRLQSGAWRMLT